MDPVRKTKGLFWFAHHCFLSCPFSWSGMWSFKRSRLSTCPGTPLFSICGWNKPPKICLVSLKFQSGAANVLKDILASADLKLLHHLLRNKTQWNSGQVLLSAFFIQIWRCYFEVITENVRFSANASKQISTGFSEVTGGFGFVVKLIVPQA